MNLSFATKFPARKKGIAGKPTFFPEKIWQSFDSQFPHRELEDKYCYKDGEIIWDIIGVYKPKIHTIRRDEKLRWHKGNYIHFNIKQSPSIDFNFAPVIQCTGKERIKIVWWKSSPNPIVVIGDTVLNLKAIEQLAFNDGFDSVDDFFSWFDKDFEGWIIHWTPYRYEVNQIDVESEVIPNGHSTSDHAIDALAYAIKSKHAESLDKKVGDTLADAIGGKVVSYGNKNLDLDEPVGCIKEYNEKICGECEFEKSEQVGHPGGCTYHSVEKKSCDWGHWEEDF